MMPAQDQPMNPACELLAPALSAYADGELDPGQCGALLRHLADCNACALRLDDYRDMSRGLRAPLEVAPVAPPPGAELRLRVAASHYAVRGQRWQYLSLRLGMAIRALALPMAVGTAAALFLFSAFAGSVYGAAANPRLPDVEVGDAAPPRLTSMPDFPMNGSVLVEAQIDATGHVYGYNILSGTLSPQLVDQLNNQLLLSVFQPATTIFGQPTTGSLVVSFGMVDVRG